MKIYDLWIAYSKDNTLIMKKEFGANLRHTDGHSMKPLIEVNTLYILRGDTYTVDIYGK